MALTRSGYCLFDRQREYPTPFNVTTQTSEADQIRREINSGSVRTYDENSEALWQGSNPLWTQKFDNFRHQSGAIQLLLNQFAPSSLWQYQQAD
ncbi:unnamed protein product [Dicrocoelium dendriticum]|nr:unnamed protein product [Dicrocoelium dendriticum]